MRRRITSWLTRLVGEALRLADVVGEGVRPVWPVLVVGVLLAQSVLGRLDGALSSMHRVGAVAGGVGDIASPTSAIEPGLPDQIVAGWTGGETLLLTYLAIDVALMTLVALLLLAFRDYATARLEAAGPDPAPARRSAVADALRWSALGVVGYVVADAGETVTAVAVAVISDDAFPEWVAIVVGIFSLLKWAALLLAAVPTVLAVVAVRDLRTEIFAGLDALRGIVLVVLLLTVLFLTLQGDIGRQIDDVVAHASESLLRGSLATALAVATCAVILRGGRLCVAAFCDVPPVRPVHPRTLRFLTVLAVVLVGLGVLVGLVEVPSLARFGGTAMALLVVPGLALLVWSVLTWPPGVRTLAPVDRPDPVAPAGRWIWILSSAPLLLLLLAVARAATTTWAVTEGLPWALFGWAAVLTALLIVVARRARRLAGVQPGSVPLRTGLRWAGTAVMVLVVAALLRSPQPWIGMGSVAVLFFFALVLTVGLVGLTLLGDAWAPRGALAVTGLRRMPVMTMIIAWGLVASMVDTEGRYYDVPLEQASSEVAWEPTDPATALTAWAGPEEDEARPPPPRSLVFVTSSGGGIRATYWTHLVWECAFGTRCGDEEDRSGQVFLASGVSGGAVGLSLVLGGEKPAAQQAEALSKDFLAPALAAAISRDLPNSVLRLPFSGNDRAAALADALASADDGLEGKFSAVAPTPYLALNGTSVEDGCRFTLSMLSQDGPGTQCGGLISDVPTAGPGASPVRGAQAFLCDRSRLQSDLRLADAAVLSARFPYVSPAATLHGCSEGAESTYVLDGGMYDNSGGSSVTNVLTALSPHLDARNIRAADTTGGAGCVIPRLLVIENQFSSIARPPETKRPLQSLGPVQTLLSFYGDRSDRELARAAQEVDLAAERAHRLCTIEATLPSVVVVHPVRAGGAAAPLGWTLSEHTRTTMAAQVPVDCRPSGGEAPTPADAESEADVLEQHRRETCDALASVRGWLEGGEP